MSRDDSHICHHQAVTRGQELLLSLLSHFFSTAGANRAPL